MYSRYQIATKKDLQALPLMTLKYVSNMSQQELTSYRLSSLQDPTDDMLHAIMEQVAESARRSTAKFQAELHRRFELIRTSNNF